MNIQEYGATFDAQINGALTVTYLVNFITSFSLVLSGRSDNITVHAAVYFCFATLSLFSFDKAFLSEN